ncbi:hypothetical protein LVJ94_32505 [Pendulispora rubella]|uniref:Lipoprotein n=1 Tax=Pendulispora rubella TaxID=2741070 RepID=A0ABZ2KSI9_9BACT
MACSSDDDKSNGGDDDRAPKSGFVSVFNSKIVVGTVEAGSYQAIASFTDASGVTGGVQGAKCETSKDGGCTLSLCPTSSGTDAGPVGDAGAAKIVHAGAIDITGASESPIRLEPQSDGQYKSAQGGKSIWAGGEDLKIHAAGNTSGVGAFDAALKAPSNVKVTAPAWGTQGPTIDRSKDLELAWSVSGGSASGQIQTLISGLAAGGGKSATLTCTHAVADGKAKIPAALLGKFEAAKTNFSMLAIEKGTQNVSPDWKVTLLLQSTATREGGAPAAGLATMQ